MSQAAGSTQSTNFHKLHKRLLRSVADASRDFGLIEANDKILVCCSGGKDSYTMLSLLLDLQKRAPFKFELVAMNLDQKQPGFPAEILPNYFEQLGVAHQIITEDTYSIVKEKVAPGKTTCALCSRLRRGIIYRTARDLGCNKIALGHHRDDILETFFLNLFYAGKLKAMPAKLKTDSGDLMLIRPLCYLEESDIARFARAMAYPIIPCNLCGAQENLQRQAMKAMLAAWGQSHKGRSNIIFKALQNIVPSHLLDREHFAFATLRIDQEGGWDFDSEISPEREFLDQFMPKQNDDGRSCNA